MWNDVSFFVTTAAALQHVRMMGDRRKWGKNARHYREKNEITACIVSA
jgi:hypothetical protein